MKTFNKFNLKQQELHTSKLIKLIKIQNNKLTIKMKL